MGRVSLMSLLSWTRPGKGQAFGLAVATPQREPRSGSRHAAEGVTAEALRHGAAQRFGWPPPPPSAVPPGLRVSAPAWSQGSARPPSSCLSGLQSTASPSPPPPGGLSLAGLPARAARVVLVALVAWLGVGGLSACDSDEGPSPLFPADFEASWVEVRDCRLSIEHDGRTIQVFANPLSAQAYVDGAYPLPDGAILVKKEHEDGFCEELDRFTVMEKVAGEWHWQRVGADRRVDTSVNRGHCVPCHAHCTDGRDLTCTDP